MVSLYKLKFSKAHRNKMIKKEMTEISQKNPFPVVILSHSWLQKGLLSFVKALDLNSFLISFSSFFLLVAHHSPLYY